MSLQPQPVPPVPAETARIARRAFPRGNPYLKLRDEWGALFDDEQFAALFPEAGQPAAAPWRLALITLLQFAEGLSDRQAAAAVRSRIDWKYLLSLELSDPGCDHTVLCEFRRRLLEGKAELLLLERLLVCCAERRLLKAPVRQRTDATHVLGAVRRLNRLELVGETLRHALNTLATVAPEWLPARCPPAWAERYARSFDELRLPATESEREAWAKAIGADGFALWACVTAPDAPAWLREVPALETLRQVWLQQYTREAIEGELQVGWRSEADLPDSRQQIVSPHDRAARPGKKRSTSWVGYKVHLTETCAPDAPLLITAVQTTPAMTDDRAVLGPIHAELAASGRLPTSHLVDAGYIDAGELVASRESYQVELVGPTPPDTSWQARAGRGFAASDFVWDWERRTVVCPAGKHSRRWQEKEGRGQTVLQVHFSAVECGRCPRRADCTRAVGAGRRLTVRTEKEQQALWAARARERTPEFQASYAARAGVEGTLSQGVRRCGLRQSRYVGEAKVHLQHTLTAAALNLVRVSQWLMGEQRARTRESAFARLMAACT